MIIKSDQIQVAANKNEIRDFLLNCTNYHLLLPEDKISNFTATENQCSFKVQGGFTIQLIQYGIDQDGNVLLKSGENSPFPFSLCAKLNEEGQNTSGEIEFDGELNSFLAMVATKPLQHLFNYMADSLKQQFTSKS
jgi:hypothetical protein